MTKVNPVQTTTYYLTPANNPITFGPGTDINVPPVYGLSFGVYGSSAQKWSVTNRGAISASPAFGVGVELADGGSVANKAGATISGWVGVEFGNFGFSGDGTVTNAGKIFGIEGGVSIDEVGLVINEAGATISGSRNGGVYIGGGTVINEDGAIISGRVGVAGGARGVPCEVENFGDIVGYQFGVYCVDHGVVNNGEAAPSAALFKAST